MSREIVSMITTSWKGISVERMGQQESKPKKSTFESSILRQLAWSADEDLSIVSGTSKLVGTRMAMGFYRSRSPQVAETNMLSILETTL